MWLAENKVYFINAYCDKLQLYSFHWYMYIKLPLMHATVMYSLDF